MADIVSSLALTGLYSGLHFTQSGSVGTKAVSQQVGGEVGYGIASAQGSTGKSYPVITLSNTVTSPDAVPPTVVVSATYSQDDQAGELDLELRYTAFPPQTSIEVACPGAPALSINKRPLSGGGLVGTSASDLGTFSTPVEIRLWIPDAAALTKSSLFSVSFAQIEGESGGPVKKVILEKLQVNLMQ